MRGFNRGNTVLALGPEKYRPTKTHFWKGTEAVSTLALARASQELERFPPSYTEQDEVFEDKLRRYCAVHVRNTWEIAPWHPPGTSWR